MSRGRITLVFDDGYEKTYQNVIPLLNEKNIKGVFALSIDKSHIEQSEKKQVRPWQDWTHIQEKGHEIAAHSVTHKDLTTLETQELKKELSEPAVQLNATTIVYPGGAHNNHVVHIANRHYMAGRTVLRGFEKMFPEDPMRLKTYNFTKNNFSPLKANLLALKAWITNTWLIETYHMIDDNETNMIHNVRTGDFKKHLSFISRLPIAKQTIYEAINNKKK